MQCHDCHAEISDNAKFCPQCGCNLANDEALRQSCAADVAEYESFISQGKGSREYVCKNFDRRLPDWKRAAQMGIWQGQWLLGRCYDEGFGVDRSMSEALSWYLKTAEQGYGPAQNYIGSCYQDGDGVPQDEAEAVKWYRKAAEQGHAVAQSNIGWCYDVGSGVAVDRAEAVKWFLKAAEQGDSAAQFNLGVHYERGSGVDEDVQEAAKWYGMAADEGDERSQKALNDIQSRLDADKEQVQKETKEAESKFRALCRRSLADGKLTVDEKDELAKLAKSLEMPKEVVKRLFDGEKKTFLANQQIQKAKDAEQRFRIACKNALSDGKVTVDERRGLRKLGESLKMSGKLMKQLFEEEKAAFLKSHQKQFIEKTVIQFRAACRKTLADGKLTVEEKDELAKLAKSLKMPKELVRQIFEKEKKLFLENHGAKRGS